MNTSKKIAGNLALLLGACLLCTACRSTPLLKSQQQGTLSPSYTPEERVSASASEEKVIEEASLNEKSLDEFLFVYSVDEHGLADVPKEELEQVYVSGYSSIHYPEYETLLSSVQGQSVVEDEISLEKQLFLSISGEKDQLTYKGTFIPAVGAPYYTYIVNGSNSQKVGLNEAGELVFTGVNFNFATVDVPKTATPGQLAAALQPVLARWVDLDDYEYVDVGHNYVPPEGFGGYSFKYYNEVSGCVTDMVSVYIEEPGVVKNLSVWRAPVSVSQIQIDHARAYEIVAAKMQDLYGAYNGDEKKTIASFEVHGTPRLEWVKGELCVEYSGIPYYRLEEGADAKMDWGIRVLIPLRMLCEEA
ncbi:MAG: hypothetical protein IJ344_06435 [Clostridia bacterium]|nr:hypothetical protein [Clostridia bacterium]